MTAQIFLDIISCGFISLSQVNLIVFDECHHAVKDHPMRRIMKLFKLCPKQRQPKILGLTATLLNSNVKNEKIDNYIHDLEITFHAKIVKVECGVNVIRDKKVEEKYMHYNEPCESSPTIEAMNNILLFIKKELKETKLSSPGLNPESSSQFQPKTKIQKYLGLVENLIDHVKQMGLYGGNEAVLLQLSHMEKIKKNTNDPTTENILKFIITQVYKIKEILSYSMNLGKENIKNKNIFLHSSDKIHKLFESIESYYDSYNYNEKFCCIIFVKKRFTAWVLYDILKNLSESTSKYKFIKPDYVLGSSNDGLKSYTGTLDGESYSTTRWNKEALIRFRAGETNCLVATDVVDEGVDIPNCSLIIRYDPPSDYRSYVQSKGRARHQTSQFIIFIGKNNFKISENCDSWREMEQTLTDVIGDPDQRAGPIPQDIIEKVYLTEIKPYIVKNCHGEDIILSDTSAVALVSRYCSTLAMSSSSPTTPAYTLNVVTSRDNNKECFYVSLKLPAGSKLKDPIKGDAMSTITLAKRSAAMKTCIALHEINELNDVLLPNDTAAPVSDDLWKIKLGCKKNVVKILNNRRMHKLVHPKVLHGAYPLSNYYVHLHVLEMEPIKSADKLNTNLFNIFTNKSGFGILSSKKLPVLPSFPLGTSTAQFKINIQYVKKLTLSSSDVKLLEDFHWLVFNDILKVIKNFITFDRDNLDNSYLVVPVDKNWKINWDLVEKQEKIISLPAKTMGVLDDNFQLTGKIFKKISRPLFRTMRDTDWQVVTRERQDDDGAAEKEYLVENVCHDMTPMTKHPDLEYTNYFEYFKLKWDDKVTDIYQPMLRVLPIKKLNSFIFNNKESQKDEETNQAEDDEPYLIPELCKIILFPALYWLKAQSLPLLMHRVTQLLIADDLRREIVLDTGLGTLNVYEWPPMISQDEQDQLNIQTKITEEKNKEKIKSMNSKAQKELDVMSLALSEDTRVNNLNWYLKRLMMNTNKRREKIFLLNEEIIKPKIANLGYSKRSNVFAPILNSINISSTRRVGPSPVEIMSTLTTIYAKDTFNLERLETLGDSFLKYIVSLYLFEKFKDESEGTLTIRKCEFIGNDNLFRCGVNKNIPGRIKVRPFVAADNFITPSYCVPRKLQKIIYQEEISMNILDEFKFTKTEQYSGKLSSDCDELLMKKIKNWPKKIDAWEKSEVDNFIGGQIINDKFVADCVEALVGIYLQKMGLEGAKKVLQWFGVLENDQEEMIIDAPTSFRIFGNGRWSAEHVVKMNYIENTVGYCFKNREYLLQALTHSSYKNQSVTEDYQSLEFIGDAVIDFLITLYIFDYCGNLSPGDLSDLRSALVNNIIFACLTVKYGLHTSLLYNEPSVGKKINEFVNFQVLRNHLIDDDLLLICPNDCDVEIAEHLDVPKILGDIFESTIGAIYLDTGKNLDKVWEILYGLMKNEIDTFNNNVPKQSVRRIFEKTSVKSKFKDAEILEDDKFIVPLKIWAGNCFNIFYGVGATQALAKSAAAKLALRFLEKNNIN